MNKTMKIVGVMLTIMLVFVMSTSVFATADWSTISVNAESTDLSNKVGGVMGQALYIMQVVGMGVAVIMLIVLAIKYISAAPGDKAEIKKHAVVYIVGAVVLFGASGILALIRNFAVTNISE